MRKYLIALICIFLAGQSFAQNTLTLDDAIKIALQRNSNLIKSKNNLSSAEKNVKSAYGDLLPSLGASGGFSWQRQVQEGYDLDFFGDVVQRTATRESRSWSAGVGGSFTLFNGLANYASISQAESDLEAAEYSIGKLKQDIIQVTNELFYSVLNADAIKKVREENVKYNEKLFETISERNNLGSVPIADVYTQKVNFGNAQLLLIRAQNDYDKALNALLDYLALNVLEDYVLTDPLKEIAMVDTEEFMEDFGEISGMVSEAFDMRLDYKSQLKNVNSYEEGMTIANSGMIPSLTGNYSYGLSSIVPADIFDNQTYRFSLSLNIPIFSNWNTENQMQFAEVQYKNSQEDLRSLERTIKIEVKQGYIDFLAGKKSLEVARENVKAAEENRRINYERYSLGSGTILDVLQSDRDYTQALSDRINAKYEFYKLRDNMLNVLGKLDYKNYE